MRPADFSATYLGCSGPLPPPHYSEHAIRIGPGLQGSAEMTAGYPGPGTPIWTERFPLGEAHLDWLFGVLSDQGLFNLDWTPSRDVPVGGGARTLRVTANGRQFEVPPFVIPEREAAGEAMLAAVRALVPPGMLESLESRQVQYTRQPPPGPVPHLLRSRTTLFEENHVGIATFLGSAMAGGTVMAINAFRLGKALSGIVMLAFGILLGAVEIYFTLAVTATGSRGANLFSTSVGVVVALGMRGLAGWLQGDDIAANVRAGGESASVWGAIGLGVLFLAILFVSILSLGLLGPR